MNEQFNISYRNELAEVIAQFRDLNDKYRRGNRPSSSEYWAYKYLLNMSNDSEIKYFTHES